MEGDPSQKFLKSVDSLELALQQHLAEASVSGIPYIDVIRAFNQVVHCSFGMELLDNWELAIKKFTKLYRQLRSKQDRPISITQKVI